MLTTTFNYCQPLSIADELYFLITSMRLRLTYRLASELLLTTYLRLTTYFRSAHYLQFTNHYQLPVFDLRATYYPLTSLLPTCNSLLSNTSNLLTTFYQLSTCEPSEYALLTTSDLCSSYYSLQTYYPRSSHVLLTT